MSQDFKKLEAKALKYAKNKHDKQMYGNNPYIYHLLKVQAVLRDFNISPDSYTENLSYSYIDMYNIYTCSTKADIFCLFGKEICDIVIAVTDDLGKTRKERKAGMFDKLSENSCALILKISDRIANVDESLKGDSFSRYKMYKKEYPDFRKLKTESQGVEILMWEHLDALMEYNL